MDTPNHDYALWYQNGPTTYKELTVDLATNLTIVTIERGDFVPGGSTCWNPYIPPGFGVVVQTFAGSQADNANGIEEVLLKVSRVWYGNVDPEHASATHIANVAGWNNVARFVIEDGAPGN
ncbi:MAG: hypothetical protein GY722_16335 [bacterium]|nr:hypothetical protein [bacterium]